jgi:hypothetical protein
LPSNDPVKQQWKRRDRCYAMTWYTHVNNGGENVFCGRCGGYITSMKPLPDNSSDNNRVNRVTTEKSAEAVQFEVLPHKKCYKIVK